MTSSTDLRACLAIADDNAPHLHEFKTKCYWQGICTRLIFKLP